jgi:hypothetical protein
MLSRTVECGPVLSSSSFEEFHGRFVLPSVVQCEVVGGQLVGTQVPSRNPITLISIEFRHTIEFTHLKSMIKSLTRWDLRSSSHHRIQTYGYIGSIPPLTPAERTTPL